MIYGTHPQAASGTAFADLELHVKDCVRTLQESEVRFDCIIVTGVSGLVVGAPLALRLRLPLLVLRKQNEASHGYDGELLGSRILDATSRVLFVDDFISEGETYRLCLEAVEKTGAAIVASCEYARFVREGVVRVIER
jgi:adenine/guanine phosphoribosyltransferase-like PRPP-binding protein